MAALGTLTFAGVAGVFPPAATPTVEMIDSPALIPAAVTLAGIAPSGRLAYSGNFASSQKAAAYALIGTTVTAYDETGASATVLIKSLDLRERPCLVAGAPAIWVEVSVEVVAWA